MATTRPLRHQRGGTLIETLAAFLVLSLGAVALAHLHGHLRLDAELARQRGEAIRLAQGELEAARHTRPFTALASAIQAPSAETPYRVERVISPTSVGDAVAASISVRWTDRSGAPQHVRLESLIDGGDARLAGALALPMVPTAPILPMAPVIPSAPS